MRRPLNRRGDSTIIANLILFIAVMGMAGAVVFTFKNMIDESTTAASDESGRSVGIMQTDFTIPSASYDGAGQVTVYVKNTGEQSFDPADMDIYLDSIRIPRDIANRTVNVTPDSDTANVGTWDPGEDLEFVVQQGYSTPATHTVTVFAPNGVKADSTFSS